MCSYDSKFLVIPSRRSYLAHELVIVYLDLYHKYMHGFQRKATRGNRTCGLLYAHNAKSVCFVSI